MNFRILLAVFSVGAATGCGQSPAQEGAPSGAALDEATASSEDAGEAAVTEQPLDGHQHDEEALPLDGPSASYGVLETIELGALALEREEVGLQGRAMRVQEITLAPGGVVAVHRHDQQPGVAYILEGEFVEHRSDMEEPVIRGVGSVIFEENEIVHWWANESDANARALLVEIVPE